MVWNKNLAVIVIFYLAHDMLNNSLIGLGKYEILLFYYLQHTVFQEQNVNWSAMSLNIFGFYLDFLGF